MLSGYRALLRTCRYKFAGDPHALNIARATARDEMEKAKGVTDESEVRTCLVCDAG